MNQTMGISAAVCQWLTEREIPAVEGWLSEPRNKAEGPIVVVTVREYTAQNAGFEHYLGERYNEDTASWEELYGRKVELILGLDLYAPERESEGAMQLLAERVAGALTMETPEGLQVGNVTCGKTEWDEKRRLLKRGMSACCTAWLQAVCTEENEFLDFELRGGWKH